MAISGAKTVPAAWLRAEVLQPIGPLATAGLIAGVFVSVGGGLSQWNSVQWAIAGLSISTISLLLGGRNSLVILYIYFGYLWCQASLDILVADIDAVPFAILAPGSGREKALVYSQMGLVCMAAGVRLATMATLRPGPGAARFAELGVGFRRTMLLYVVMAITARVIGFLPLPGALTQLAFAFGTLKLVALYVAAACCVKESRWGMLAALLFVEIAIGMSGYISSFQSAVMVILAAVVAGRRRITPAIAVGGAAVLAVLFAAALFWTAVKPTYRTWTAAQERSLSDRIEWLGDFAFGGSFDVAAAGRALVMRIGYTTYFAYVVERKEAGLISDDVTYWTAALEHVFVPRLLNPDKPILDDTAVTSRLTGITLKDASISVGYVAQAFADFGFPMMLLPLGAIGFLIGWVAWYFLQRPSLAVLRIGFATAVVAFTLPFEANVDKALGGFVALVLVFIVVERYAGAKVSAWLVGAR